jgi:quinolinate synthase
MNDQQLTEKILQLKRQRNAVILAHNYQRPEVQEIADFVGDSLGLSRAAGRTGAQVIVFCGVHFMAETAAILCPGKTVLLPDPQAGCPMADMITAGDLRELKAGHPQAAVLAYVNTSAEVKAETDICCTSSNALSVVRSLPADREIIFVPDKYLAHYVSSMTGRTFITWTGYCPTHVKIQAVDIQRQRSLHPAAKVVVHPECTPAVTGLADAVLSTEGMIAYSLRSDAAEIIVGTEVGVLHRLRKEMPGKMFYPASEQAVCPNMKRITLEKVLWSLERLQPEVRVPDGIAARARAAVDRMVAVA